MTNSADPDLQRPTDLDLHCLQRQGISVFSRTRVKTGKECFFLLYFGGIRNILNFFLISRNTCTSIMFETRINLLPTENMMGLIVQ